MAKWPCQLQSKPFPHRREGDVTWHSPEVTKPNPWQTPQGAPSCQPSPSPSIPCRKTCPGITSVSPQPKPLHAGGWHSTMHPRVFGDPCPKQQCPREPGQHQDIGVHWHRARHHCVCLAAGSRRQKQTPARHHQCKPWVQRGLPGQAGSSLRCPACGTSWI